MPYPYVGILINNKLHRRIPLGKTKYEAVDFYVEAGKKYGFTPCFFRIEDYKLGSRQVSAYVKDSDKFIKKNVPAPDIIHNRAIYSSQKQNQKLQSMVKAGKQIFNRWNRYSKLRIQKLLNQESNLRPHLPGTYEATPGNIAIMMRRYDQLIIKPNKSSIGRGVMKMERVPTGWKLTYPASLHIHNKRWRTLNFKDSRLPLVLKNKIKKRPYIVQQRLPLATFNGRPFDLRVSVQRGGTGQWQVTGIVAKVASDKNFLTNVAQGATLHRLEDILIKEYSHLKANEVIRNIQDFSVRIAKYLAICLPHIADLGLDVGITTDGFPMFIECNSKDQRYSFREAGMDQEWQATYFTPMAYAKYLLDRGPSTQSDP